MQTENDWHAKPLFTQQQCGEKRISERIISARLEVYTSRSGYNPLAID